MITIANADAVLKEYYLDAVTAQLNEGISPFFNAVEKTTKNVFGKDVKMLIARKSANGVVAGDEDGALPAAQANRYYNVTVPLKNIYGTIEISDKAIRASQDSSGAFVNVLNAEMEGLVAGAKENFSRMIFGNSSAAIATVTAVNKKVLTVTYCKSWFDGMKVDIYSGTSRLVKGLTVSAVDVAAKTVTLNLDVTNYGVSAGCTLNVFDAFGKELEGLGGIFDGDTLYGYKKSENFYFSPYVHSVSKLSEQDIIDAVDALEERTGSKVAMMVCSPTMRKKVASVLTDTRTVVTGAELAGGYTSIYVNDVPLVTDRFCPDDRIYFLNPGDFVLNQLCDWEWLEDEDGKILKQVSGKAAYCATLVKYAELVCSKPYAQGAVIVTD